jgi:hypothetical protein
MNAPANLKPDLSQPSWPLRLEQYRDTPWLADCLKSIAADAKRADDLDWYWAAQNALDGHDLGGEWDLSEIDLLIRAGEEEEREEEFACDSRFEFDASARHPDHPGGW